MNACPALVVGAAFPVQFGVLVRRHQLQARAGGRSPCPGTTRCIRRFRQPGCAVPRPVERRHTDGPRSLAVHGAGLHGGAAATIELVVHVGNLAADGEPLCAELHAGVQGLVVVVAAIASGVRGAGAARTEHQTDGRPSQGTRVMDRAVHGVVVLRVLVGHAAIAGRSRIVDAVAIGPRELEAVEARRVVGKGRLVIPHVRVDRSERAQESAADSAIVEPEVRVARADAVGRARSLHGPRMTVAPGMRIPGRRIPPGGSCPAPAGFL